MKKILMGGSPCTYWSIAQKNGRETEPSGMGWELFENYRIAKEKFKPDIFLYENNKSAAKAIKNEIKKGLKVWDGTFLMEDTGARYIEINSALVSAQNRQRFYVHNCGDVEQPEDRGILLKDILESGNQFGGDEKSYCLVSTYYKGQTPNRILEKHQRTMVAEPVNITPDGKSQTIKGQYVNTSLVNICCYKSTYGATGVAEPVRIPRYSSEKSRPLTACYSKNCGGFESRIWSEKSNKQQVDLIAEPVRIGDLPNSNGKISGSQATRIYSTEGKSINLVANGGGQGAKTGLYAEPIYFGAEVVEFDDNGKPVKARSYADGKIYIVYEVKDSRITIKDKQYPIKLEDGFYIIRKLTVTECCRLQTLPDDYCRAVSASQGYKGLGNGWTAEVIIHILNSALKDVPKDEKIVVLSMYDGIGTGRYCLDKMGFTNVEYHAYEIDKYAMQIAMSNYPDIIQHGDAFGVRDEKWELRNYGKTT